MKSSLASSNVFLWFFQSFFLSLLFSRFFLGPGSMKKFSGAKHAKDYLLLNIWGNANVHCATSTAILLALLFRLCPNSSQACNSYVWTDLPLNHLWEVSILSFTTSHLILLASNEVSGGDQLSQSFLVLALKTPLGISQTNQEGF